MRDVGERSFWVPWCEVWLGVWKANGVGESGFAVVSGELGVLVGQSARWEGNVLIDI